MVGCEELPFKESMKHKLRDGWYCYGDMPISRPKTTEMAIDFWYYHKGQRPHSHCWGRKPYWRKKRRNQRRTKQKERGKAISAYKAF